jgi:hypothetical protein
MSQSYCGMTVGIFHLQQEEIVITKAEDTGWGRNKIP